MSKYIFFFSSFLFVASLHAQTKVLLKDADLLYSSTVNGVKVDKIIGDVWLIQGNTNIYCDSAYLYKNTNSATAFGHVKIIDTVDSLDLRGDYLEYTGDNGLAKMRKNVVMKDDSTSLFTDFLDYDRAKETAYYFKGGKMVDSTNVLTSQRGYYYTKTKKALFLDSVFLENSDFNLYADSLNYSTLDKVAITNGRTLGVSTDGDSLKTDVGFIYKSLTKYSKIYEGWIKTADYEIKGDTLIADDSLKFYQADRNVEMRSYTDSLTIYGDHARYYKNDDLIYVYGNSYLKKMMRGDSLFIKGDTLKSVQKEKENIKYLSFYHNVKLYKSDFQGAADSLSYNLLDSTIYMYNAPLIWNADSQISADSLRIQLANSKISKMFLKQNSFVISQDSAENFNQIKGREMVVDFKNGFISKTDVFGNGESIYFAFNQKDGSLSMNKLTCSNMALSFENNIVTELRTYREVDGKIIPEPEIIKPDKKLRGFKWLFEQKPNLATITKKDDNER
ncbi:MAG: lipopolysaccharide export system protein LptA [Roseivirga sp.]|jgi:lipopolysaccharide export system protein LptA